MNIQKRRRRTNEEGEIRSAAVENCILPVTTRVYGRIKNSKMKEMLCGRHISNNKKDARTIMKYFKFIHIIFGSPSILLKHD